MQEMDHIMHLGFPVSLDMFSMVDWELYKLWRDCIDEEIQIRDDMRRDENSMRSKAGQKPRAAERY